MDNTYGDMEVEQLTDENADMFDILGVFDEVMRFDQQIAQIVAWLVVELEEAIGERAAVKKIVARFLK